MATFQKFNNFVQNLGLKTILLTTDTFKVMLTNTAPVATNSVYADISANELASGNGYTTGGAAVTGTGYTNATGTSSFSASATTFTSVTGNMGPFRYVVYYDSTDTNKSLCGFYDYGSSITLNGAAGETFIVTPAGSVLFTIA
jgi:hypothetical protein